MLLVLLLLSVLEGLLLPLLFCPLLAGHSLQAGCGGGGHGAPAGGGDAEGIMGCHTCTHGECSGLNIT